MGCKFAEAMRGLEHSAPCRSGSIIGQTGGDRSRMRSENFDWFRELGADSHEFNKQVQHLGKGRWLWYPKWLWDKNTAI